MFPDVDDEAPTGFVRRTDSALTSSKNGKRQRVLWAAALLWVVLLVGVLVLFAFVGEEWWPVVILLYLPRHFWLAPGLLLLPFAVRRGRRALLCPLSVGGLLWLFPLMGFVWPRHAAPASGPALRLLSYNTGHAVDGVEGLRNLVLETRADVVLFQWTSHLAAEALSGPGFEGWTVQRAGQFTVATRFQVLSLETGGLAFASDTPCAHAVLDTPLGELDVYNIRPHSAREEIGARRHQTIRQRLFQLYADARNGRLAGMAAFRSEQIRSIVEMISKAQRPVLIAGDLNLPQGSALVRRFLGSFKDAFVESDWGFGFTHPAKLPWLRLDRVLLGRGLAAAGFQVLPRHASAHRPVLAEIVRSK